LHRGTRRLHAGRQGCGLAGRRQRFRFDRTLRRGGPRSGRRPRRQAFLPLLRRRLLGLAERERKWRTLLLLLLRARLLPRDILRRARRRIAEKPAELGARFGSREAKQGGARCHSNEPGNVVSLENDRHRGPGFGNLTPAQASIARPG
jgi:hypothetical protein